MTNDFARASRLGRRAVPWLVSSALLLPGAAWADCTPLGAPAGSTVTCTGTSVSYINAAQSLQVVADKTTVLTAPLSIGNGIAAAPATLNLASGGTISGSTAAPSVQYGDFANITNAGSITSSSSTAGAAAIQVGSNSFVTNNGTLTAASGTPAVSFTASGNNSTNGTFTNGATATAAVTGNISFGTNIGANVGTFVNAYNTATTSTSTATYGLNGNVIGTGNLAIDNEGQWTGQLQQTNSNIAAVSFTNGGNASFSGTIITGNTTVLVNNAAGKNPAGFANGMLLQNSSIIGNVGNTGTSFTNNGTLSVGSSAAPALLTINGRFAQTANGILNIAISSAGTVSAMATSQPYSQINVVGGTAALAGTLNVNVAAGYYPAGSVFKVIQADQGITGNFTSPPNVINANGTALPFLTFSSLGVVTVNGAQQAYEFTVQRNGTYASVIGSQVLVPYTTADLAIATALQPLTLVAQTNSTGQEAALIGQIDQLTVAQAVTLFDQLSPAGYLSYATALRDQANEFSRQIDLRLLDHNSDHAEDGWWGSLSGQVDVSKASLTASKEKIFALNLGYDVSGPHHVLGIAGTASFDSLHNLGSTLKGHNRDYAIAAYGGYMAGPLHLTGQVGYNFGHLTTTRNLTFGAVATTASAKASEHLLKATGTAGIMLKAGGYTFEPFAGIDYMKGKVKTFTETGDGAAALTVSPIKADRTDALAGLSLSRSSGKLRPYLRAAYRAEIGHSGDSTVMALFDENNGTLFTVAGVPAARHEVDANAGVNVVFEDAGSLFLGYEGTFRSGYSSHGINLGVRLEF
jgi:uncharacterized protein with beta-barrel porin domain